MGAYTGPGGMTIQPHRAAAKLELRLMPDVTRANAVARLRAHLERRGFGDIEVNVTDGYDLTTNSPDARLVRAAQSVYESAGIDPILWPRRGGSWPGYLFTGAPLALPAGHFGLGHGLRAHAPDEYFLIESVNPKVAGQDGAVRSLVDYLYAFAQALGAGGIAVAAARQFPQQAAASFQALSSSACTPQTDCPSVLPCAALYRRPRDRPAGSHPTGPASHRRVSRSESLSV